MAGRVRWRSIRWRRSQWARRIAALCGDDVTTISQARKLWRALRFRPAPAGEEG